MSRVGDFSRATKCEAIKRVQSRQQRETNPPQADLRLYL